LTNSSYLQPIIIKLSSVCFFCLFILFLFPCSMVCLRSVLVFSFVLMSHSNFKLNWNWHSKFFFLNMIWYIFWFFFLFIDIQFFCSLHTSFSFVKWWNILLCVSFFTLFIKTLIYSFSLIYKYHLIQSDILFVFLLCVVLKQVISVMCHPICHLCSFLVFACFVILLFF